MTSLRGFTLVEMLVVLAIIVFITSVALLGQSQFNNSLILTDTAYNVAFSVREAQSLGLSSRTATAQGAGYGLYFSSANPPGTGGYYLFGDITNSTAGISTCPVGAPGTPEGKPGNCVYDYNDVTPPIDSIVRNYQFSRGFTVDHFCGQEQDAGLTWRCSDATNSGYLNRLNIVFQRPNTDTIITGVRTASPYTLTPLHNAELFIKSPSGAFRSVCVTSVGQIFVATSSCPFNPFP
jgi:prepilin-type N-terminal cleavage/methylation domain-containing protein